jgi:thiamine-phosphate pyrophosphorylase
MKKYISKFHYITQDMSHRSHAEQVEIACKAGANWVQYRCLTKSDEELIKEINEIALTCDDWGATLILSKHYHLLNQVDAQGVHIEDFAEDPIRIRNLIGEDKTMGWSASNIAELQSTQIPEIDYVYYGPFRYTDLQPDRKALLGYDGYKNIKIYQKLNIPVLAVGGVQLADVDDLLTTEIYGIAASGAINYSSDSAKTLKDFYHKIY